MAAKIQNGRHLHRNAHKTTVLYVLLVSVRVSLPLGLLTIIDHNPSSTTAGGSFHGTGISLFQFPTQRDHGQFRTAIMVPPTCGGKHSLPESYANVPAVDLKTTSVSVAECNMLPFQGCLLDAKTVENKWSEHALKLLDTCKSELTKEDAISWAAYHACQQSPPDDPPAVHVLLPLFYEKAACAAMVKHGMDVQKHAINFLNPGQIPVTTFDQPLFALAKFVQWKWPSTHGEHLHVVMLGGLHTELALWKTLEDLLDCSGWTSALTEAALLQALLIHFSKLHIS